MVVAPIFSIAFAPILPLSMLYGLIWIQPPADLWILGSFSARVTEEYDSDYNGELDFYEFRKVLHTPTMTKKIGLLGLGCEEAESLLLS